METFELSIVGPILALSPDFVTDPAKRESAPLPAKTPLTSFASLSHYIEAMKHALTHETLQTIGSDYDERDCHASIRLEVNGYEKARSAERCCVLDCEITCEKLAEVSRKLPDGRKADFFIQDSTVGLIRAEGGDVAVLAFITDKNRRR